jgi:integrase
MRDFIKCIGNIDYLKVKHQDGEYFLQYFLEKGNSPATVGKKLRQLKRIFQLAVERRQLEENPLKYVKQPKVPKKQVRIFSPQDCEMLIKAAMQYQGTRHYLQWELLIRLALCTAMRRGELLNITWRDIDFDKRIIEVSPKQNSDFTWPWQIKDTDRRKLPLTDQVVTMLAELQSAVPEGYPYVFIPTKRYDLIQSNRQVDKWSMEQGKCPVNNFTRQFREILRMAGLKDFEFHDLRRTCLSRWLENGLSEFEVMNLAGHAKFETTRKFYLAVNSNIIDKARAALEEPLKSKSVANLLQRQIRTEQVQKQSPVSN